jgi:arsenate reductase
VNDAPIRVIFVCTGNSARSQMAEALLRRDGGDRFEVVSAGVEPRGVHPLTVRALAEIGIDISAARSKSVAEFLGQPFDYVITVCDRARESCPVFPGGAQTLHWGFDDPAEATGSEDERLAVFRRVLGEIAGRIRLFVRTASPQASSTR